jgi:8-oxoguanine deaminase
MDLSEDDGGLPPAAVVQSIDDILADSERLVGRHHDPRDGALVQIALAPCSPFSVSRDLMRASADLAARQGLRLHTHLAAHVGEVDYCLERFGCRPIDYMEQVGWLGPNVWLAHGIFFSPEEWERLAAAGVSIAHCPTSNMITASGFCPVPDLEAAGVKVGLGVDGSSANDSSSMIGEMRQAFLLQRAVHGVSRVAAADALRWATAGGAACLGRPDIGTLAPGRQADLALFRADGLPFTGADDALAALVRSAPSGADRVMVAGRWIVEEGTVPGLDIAGLTRAHTAAARGLRARASL